MSDPNTASTSKAAVIHSPKMAKRIARVIIDRAKKEGVADSKQLYALTLTPELDALVAKEIRIYKRYARSVT